MSERAAAGLAILRACGLSRHGRTGLKRSSHAMMTPSVRPRAQAKARCVHIGAGHRLAGNVDRLVPCDDLGSVACRPSLAYLPLLLR
jgi:hypothetical protein